MRLLTDDDIYRARLVYLGPPGHSLPVQLPYTQYAVFAVTLALLIGVRFLLTWHISLFPTWEIAGAMVVSSVVFRYVDPDRPVRNIVGVLVTDWRRTARPDVEVRQPRLSGRRIVIRADIH